MAKSNAKADPIHTSFLERRDSADRAKVPAWRDEFARDRDRIIHRR